MPAEPSLAQLDPAQRAALNRLVVHHDAPLRQQLFDIFESRPEFKLRYGLTKEDQRRLTRARWDILQEHDIFRDTISGEGPDAIGRYDAIIETCGMLDHSLSILLAVNFGLFGSSIRFLGDDEQKRHLLPMLESRKLIGCFALTELGHGSNARGILTTSTFVSAAASPTGQPGFVVHTPSDEAQKYWIGGAFQTARWAAVFAQLAVGGEEKGVHAFLVRIREDDGTERAGVTLADCGEKEGLNGVDNGRIWFDKVFIPLSQLLRRDNQVSPDGTYTSRYATADERFAAAMGGLTGGRVFLANSSINQSKIALAIAIRYSFSRRAFAPPGEEDRGEVPIIEYQSHQVRLMPHLATTYVNQMVANRLKTEWRTSGAGKEVHVWSSGFKALMTWNMADVLQECREACGGQGYKSENRIGPLKSEHDVQLTFEGDNHILLNVVSKILLTDYAKQFRAGRFRSSLEFLNDADGLLTCDTSALPVRSRNFTHSVFRRREARLLRDLGQRIMRQRKDGVSMYNAFVSTQSLSEDLARAHVERLVFEVFCGVVDTVEDPGLRDLLDLCGTVHALKRVDEQAVFVRNECLSPKKAREVHEELIRLCAVMKEHSLELVECFGIPDFLLAPIAFDWVDHNARARL